MPKATRQDGSSYYFIGLGGDRRLSHGTKLTKFRCLSAIVNRTGRQTMATQLWVRGFGSVACDAVPVNRELQESPTAATPIGR